MNFLVGAMVGPAGGRVVIPAMLANTVLVCALLILARAALTRALLVSTGIGVVT